MQSPLRATVSLLVLLACCLPISTSAQTTPVVRMAVVMDGPWEGNDQVRSQFEQEILELTAGEFDVRFPEDKLVVSDWTIDGVGKAVDGLLADREVDFILAIGVLASHYACQQKTLNKPVIAPIVIDAEMQGLPYDRGVSGVKNLNYLVFPKNIERDLQAFRTIVPFKKVAIMVNKRVRDAIPDMPLRAARILRSLDVEPTIIAVERSIEEALGALGPDIEAVYVAPLLHLLDGEFDRLVATLIERKLPSFSLLGKREVERGLLAGMGVDTFPRMARRVALNVQRVLLGEDAGTLPVAFSARGRLTINMATARAIGVYPSWGVLTDADLLNERRETVERTLSLQGVTKAALAANLDLAVAEKTVLAGEQDIKLARSDLLPQIDLSLLGLQIDDDRAENSVGQQSERTLEGSVTLEQILFAEPAWANLTIQKHFQHVRERERDILKLDIARATATSYLNVLRAKTFERIQKDNLAQTRSNLELARIREAIGTARAAEVLRWDSEIANNRKAVIDANSQRNIAEIDLNRLMNRPEEERFLTEEVGLDDPELLLSQGRLLKYMDNPWDFRLLRAFMVKEGLETTPEIQALKEAIAAQDRAVSSASRKFWIPALSLQGELTNVFGRDGAGSEFTPPTGLSGVFSLPEDVSWSVGIGLSYNLFSGGAKFAERRQAVETLGELRLQLASTEQIIEQRIRSALHTMGASYAGIEQARLAAAAAGQSLELVEDAYSRGATTILDLLDAQNNALVAEEVAANAVYDFLIDLMEVERSIGKLALQMTGEERETFFRRMDTHFNQSAGSGN